MTLQIQHTANAPATLSDEQRRRVADALENAQSENTRRNYAGQYRKFRAWCEREEQSALPAQPEVVAAYAAELAEDGKSMSTIRLAVAAIVDAHRSVGLESPQITGVTETLRGLSRQLGVGQKQATAARCRRSGRNQGNGTQSPRTVEWAARLRWKRLRYQTGTAWTSHWRPYCLMRACVSLKPPALRWREVLDAENGAGLVYIERSKTDQEGEGAYVVSHTPDTLTGVEAAGRGFRSLVRR